jgi:hypothetical protein
MATNPPQSYFLTPKRSSPTVLLVVPEFESGPCGELDQNLDQSVGGGPPSNQLVVVRRSADALINFFAVLGNPN